jgi:hypothetical protein
VSAKDGMARTQEGVQQGADLMVPSAKLVRVLAVPLVRGLSGSERCVLQAGTVESTWYCTLVGTVLPDAPVAAGSRGKEQVLDGAASWLAASSAYTHAVVSARQVVFSQAQPSVLFGAHYFSG